MSRCVHCKFSRRGVQLGGAGLFCRVNPPVLHFTPLPPNQGGGALMNGVWPPVDEDGWCGRYEDDPVLVQ